MKALYIYLQTYMTIEHAVICILGKRNILSVLVNYLSDISANYLLCPTFLYTFH